MSISVNKRPKTALQSLEADKENQPNDVNRRRSKSKANKPLGKTSIRIEEPNRGRDLLTPANRIAVHFKEQLGKSLLSKSHERKTSKSTRKSERPRINLLMEPGDKKARPFCGTGRPPHNAHNPRQILEISSNDGLIQTIWREEDSRIWGGSTSGAAAGECRSASRLRPTSHWTSTALLKSTTHTIGPDN